MPQSCKERLRTNAARLKTEIAALVLALKDKRVPWYAKAVVWCVVVYALSPIDLIPDFIPVIGYLDDLIVLPLGIMLAIRLIPQPLMDEFRAKAKTTPLQKSWIAALFVVLLWIAIIGSIVFVILMI